jgi:ABC-type nickel/cobalt efflux system permease component RcnA
MTMSRVFLPVIVLAAILLLGTSLLAQQPVPSKSPFGLPSPGTQTAQPAGPLQRAQTWVLEKQAQFNRELAAAVRSLKTANPLSATLLLAALSFAYGVLHAAGPGHGKAVISSYVLADGRTVRRGILLAFLAALIQALSALAVVGVLVLVLRASGLQIRAMEAWLETASWALVALVGVWLLYYQLRSAFRPAHAHAGHHHHHADHHHHDHGAHAHAHAHAPHTHAGGHSEACEVCAHLPAAAELQGDWSWRRALALAFAVGVRPCTGAILVLVFAIGQGLLWAGVLSTFAMALGTAITVSVLAASAVGFRELAARLAGGGASKWADRVQMAAGLVGASLVLLLGAAFFWASLGANKPF